MSYDYSKNILVQESAVIGQVIPSENSRQQVILAVAMSAIYEMRSICSLSKYRIRRYRLRICIVFSQLFDNA